MPFQIRPIHFRRSYTRYAEGSVLISMGNTQVLCNASVSEDVPSFLRGKGKGWVTAEYSMLPYSTLDRKARDITKGRIDGRSTEIQRLIAARPGAGDVCRRGDADLAEGGVDPGCHARVARLDDAHRR